LGAESGLTAKLMGTVSWSLAEATLITVFLTGAVSPLLETGLKDVENTKRALVINSFFRKTLLIIFQ
jgi:hypothetical protein